MVMELTKNDGTLGVQREAMGLIIHVDRIVTAKNVEKYRQSAFQLRDILRKVESIEVRELAPLKEKTLIVREKYDSLKKLINSKLKMAKSNLGNYQREIDKIESELIANRVNSVQTNGDLDIIGEALSLADVHLPVQVKEKKKVISLVKYYNFKIVDFKKIPKKYLKDVDRGKVIDDIKKGVIINGIESIIENREVLR